MAIIAIIASILISANSSVRISNGENNAILPSVCCERARRSLGTYSKVVVVFLIKIEFVIYALDWGCERMRERVFKQSILQQIG